MAVEEAQKQCSKVQKGVGRGMDGASPRTPVGGDKRTILSLLRPPAGVAKRGTLVSRPTAGSRVCNFAFAPLYRLVARSSEIG